MPKHGTFLRDIGSGNGFLLSPSIFTYEGRRSYLHPEEVDLSKLEPPEMFMTKQQVRRVRHVEEAKDKVACNTRLQSIKWIAAGGHVRPSDTSLISSLTRPVDLLLDSFYPSSSASVISVGSMTDKATGAAAGLGGAAAGGGGGSHHHHHHVGPVQRRSKGGRGSRVSYENEEIEYPMEDWEPRLEAGARFYRNIKTGECREQLPAGRRRDSEMATKRKVDKQKDEDEGIGVGALVYDPRECHELFAFLDCSRVDGDSNSGNSISTVVVQAAAS